MVLTATGQKSQKSCCRSTASARQRTTVESTFAGLVESNGSLPPGLWLTSPAGWLPGTGISSGTLRSAVEYGLPSPFTAWSTAIVVIDAVRRRSVKLSDVCHCLSVLVIIRTPLQRVCCWVPCRAHGTQQQMLCRLSSTRYNSISYRILTMCQVGTDSPQGKRHFWVDSGHLPPFVWYTGWARKRGHRLVTVILSNL